MLNRQEKKVIHPVWGTIRLNDKFTRVLELPAFKELAWKSQLGSKMFSSYFLNAKHTRLLHSIGVMYVNDYLMKVCESKFWQYFTITDQEKEILGLAGVGHDLGHWAFSHSAEDRNKKTHEERTIELFEENREALNNIFGYDITSEVIAILKDNVRIKKDGKRYHMGGTLDILFILRSLLIGTIDADRIEYLTSDIFIVRGQKVNFLQILDYLTIILKRGNPVIGFEEEALPLLEDFLLTRADQYQYDYYEDSATFTEIRLKEFMALEKFPEDVTESEVIATMHRILRDETQKGTLRWRLADVIVGENTKDLLTQTFATKEEYEYFLAKINAIVPDRSIVKVEHKKIVVYDKEKNQLYIKCNNGLVKDITEVSNKIKDLCINCYYVMIDVDPLYDLDPQVVKNLRELFEDNPVENEKKFTLEEILPEEPHFENLYMEEKRNEHLFSMVLEKLSAISKLHLTEWKQIKNDDLYYEIVSSKEGLPEETTMRYRTITDKEQWPIEKKSEYYIKIPADDGTSIVKRKEQKFPNCASVEEYLTLVEGYLKSEKIQIEEKIQVIEGVKIRTQRFKNLAEMQGNCVEVSCDFSCYEYEGKKEYDEMLECELKKPGDDLCLWFLTQDLLEQGFRETNESKLTRAKRKLEVLK